MFQVSDNEDIVDEGMMSDSDFEPEGEGEAADNRGENEEPDSDSDSEWGLDREDDGNAMDEDGGDGAMVRVPSDFSY